MLSKGGLILYMPPGADLELHRCKRTLNSRNLGPIKASIKDFKDHAKALVLQYRPPNPRRADPKERPPNENGPKETRSKESWPKERWPKEKWPKGRSPKERWPEKSWKCFGFTDLAIEHVEKPLFLFRSIFEGVKGSTSNQRPAPTKRAGLGVVENAKKINKMKPNFETKYSLGSSWRDQSDLHASFIILRNFWIQSRNHEKRFWNISDLKVQQFSSRLLVAFLQFVKKVYKFRSDLCWNLSVARSPRKNGGEKR